MVLIFLKRISVNKKILITKHPSKICEDKK